MLTRIAVNMYSYAQLAEYLWDRQLDRKFMAVVGADSQDRILIDIDINPEDITALLLSAQGVSVSTHKFSHER